MLKRFLLQSPWTYRMAMLGLGLIFIWAGAVKIVDPRAFARTISGYGLLPDALLVPVAIGLPVIELLVGLGLALDFRGSLKAVIGLLMMFLLVLGYAIFNDMDVDCGCFSAEEVQAQNNLRIAFFRDLALMGTASYLLFRRWNRSRPEKQSALQTP